MSRAAAFGILPLTALARPCASQGPRAQRGDATVASAAGHRHRALSDGSRRTEVAV